MSLADAIRSELEAHPQMSRCLRYVGEALAARADQDEVEFERWLLCVREEEARRGET